MTDNVLNDWPKSFNLTWVFWFVKIGLDCSMLNRLTQLQIIYLSTKQLSIRKILPLIFFISLWLIINTVLYWIMSQREMKNIRGSIFRIDSCFVDKYIICNCVRRLSIEQSNPILTNQNTQVKLKLFGQSFSTLSVILMLAFKRLKCCIELAEWEFTLLNFLSREVKGKP